MAHEIDLGGTIYISSKRAAEITGYTQDYVGQLARGRQILAQRISGLWYVVEQSLRDYKAKADEFKPEPPKPIQPMQDVETMVSFDGRDYVSAQRGATITGYHQDYVGQLARSGKILSRQIGNRWYVDREGLVEHKRYNDSLLAAIQAESVGLSTEDAKSDKIDAKEDHVHYTYTTEPNIRIPQVAKKEIASESENIYPESTESDEIHEIPIRIIPARQSRNSMENRTQRNEKINAKISRMTIFLLVFLAAALSTGGYLIYSGTPVSPSALIAKLRGAQPPEPNQQVLVANLYILNWQRPDFILELISKELVYTRKNDF